MLATKSGASGEITISTTLGQWSLDSIPAANGTYAAVPGMATYFQCWHRDTSDPGPSSNFTDGCVIFWEP